MTERIAETDAVETTTFLAQYRDWADEWCDDGRVFDTAREARDGCIKTLSSLGYSGADVRVLRRRSTTPVLEVMTAEEVRDA